MLIETPLTVLYVMQIETITGTKSGWALSRVDAMKGFRPIEINNTVI